MLTASELTGMREVMASTLPGTVTISRATASSDGMGGYEETWANVGTALARVSQAGTGSETITGGGVAAVAPLVVTLPAGTDVSERDRIGFGTATLEIVAVSEPRDWSLSVRCDCREVK